MSEQNKAVIRRAVKDVWSGGNPDTADEIIDASFVGHAPPDNIIGLEGYKRYFAGLRNAFPELNFTIEEQIGEGNRVVTRWTAGGTNTGEFQGMPPTDQHCTVTGISIDTVVGGKSVECWTNLDHLGLLQQLGVIPVPEPAAAY